MEALAPGVLKPYGCAGMKAPAGVLNPVGCKTGCASMEALAGYRSPGNREIAIRDQLLVYGSGLPVSFVDND